VRLSFPMRVRISSANAEACSVRNEVDRLLMHRA
jgi:hypothetical protein